MDLKGEGVFVQHPVYWFDDGSVILRVQDYGFKVHGALLSHHSTFFSRKGLPSGPAMPESETTSPSKVYFVIDPNLRVLAEDVEVLLDYFYHDTHLFSEERYSRIASILRVSSPSQLDFPSMHTLAKERLYSIFHSGPSDMDNPEDVSLSQTMLMRKFLYYNIMISPDFSPEPNVAQSPNGDSLIGHSSLESTKATETTSDISSPDTDLTTDTELSTHLMTRTIEHFTPILFTPPGTSHMACTDVFAETWMTLVIQPAIENDGVYKPLETLERIKDIDWAKEGLCPSCVVEKQDEWTEEQRNIWKAMDEWLFVSTESLFPI